MSTDQIQNPDILDILETFKNFNTLYINRSNNIIDDEYLSTIIDIIRYSFINLDYSFIQHLLEPTQDFNKLILSKLIYGLILTTSIKSGLLLEYNHSHSEYNSVCPLCDHIIFYGEICRYLVGFYTNKIIFTSDTYFIPNDTNPINLKEYPNIEFINCLKSDNVLDNYDVIHKNNIPILLCHSECLIKC